MEKEYSFPEPWKKEAEAQKRELEDKLKLENKLEEVRKQRDALMELVGRVGEKADVHYMRAEEEAERAEKLAQEAGMDKLTGLLNRRGFQEAYEGLLKARRAEGGGRRSAHDRFTIVLLDIDRFKSINDTYGHGAGDVVIREAADYLRSQVRAHDIIERHGGDEFVILLGRAEASDIHKKLHDKILTVNTADNEGQPVAIEVSFSGGMTSFVPGDNNLKEALIVADKALYLAKRGTREGKSQILIAEED